MPAEKCSCGRSIKLIPDIDAHLYVAHGILELKPRSKDLIQREVIMMRVLSSMSDDISRFV